MVQLSLEFLAFRLYLNLHKHFIDYYKFVVIFNLQNLILRNIFIFVFKLNKLKIYIFFWKTKLMHIYRMDGEQIDKSKLSI